MEPKNIFGLQFHHLGLASKNEDRSICWLEGLGYQIGELVFDPLQQVNLRMCTAAAMPDVEIVSPVDETGPLSSILQSAESTIYHSCFVTHDLAESVHTMKSSGVRIICISPPKPAILFEGRHVSFYAVRGGGIIELLEAH